MNYPEAQMITQLLASMEEAVRKMEQYFNRRDIENFNKAKAVVLEFQGHIAKILSPPKEKKEDDASRVKA